MKILIFEDNESELHNLIDCLHNFFNKYKFDLKYLISNTMDTEFVLNHIYDYDIFFLDIEVNHFNGIDIGVQIRKINRDATIIFVSNYFKYLIDGYKAQANRYFIKPIDQEVFNLEMNTIILDYIRNFDGFLDSKIYPKKIYYKEIYYVEHISRKSYLHLSNGNVIKTTYTLKYWKELFPSYFIQTHKSFLVNLNYISGFKKKEIILENEENIPISRVFRKQLEDAYSISIRRSI